MGECPEKCLLNFGKRESSERARGIDALANDRNVELRNFGVFEIQVRKARIGRNPNNPTINVIIPERAVVRFKAGRILKEKLKQLSLDTLKGR